MTRDFRSRILVGYTLPLTNTLVCVLTLGGGAVVTIVTTTDISAFVSMGIALVVSAIPLYLPRRAASQAAAVREKAAAEAIS